MDEGKNIIRMLPAISRITSVSVRSLSCLTISGKNALSTAVRRPYPEPRISFNVHQCSAARNYSQENSTGLAHPTHRPLQHPLADPSIECPQAWLETLRSLEDPRQALVDLHPDVFATFPRMDILHRNIYWQRTYKRISMAKTKSRAEVRGGGRKPWRQKGSGRARHGSRRSPLWIGGGKSTGPRGPRSYWFVLPTKIRAQGLRVALTVKYTQDDLHIVDSLDIPVADPQYLQDLCKERYWGESVLFVDNKPLEDMPLNFLEAVKGIKTFNVLPAEGLNVYSMLKHKTLVITMEALDLLESRLLHHLYSYSAPKLSKNLPIMHSQLGMDSFARPRGETPIHAQETEV